MADQAFDIKNDLSNTTLGHEVYTQGTNNGLTIGRGTNLARDIAFGLEDNDKDNALKEILEEFGWTDSVFPGEYKLDRRLRRCLGSTRGAFVFGVMTNSSKLGGVIEGGRF